MRSRVVFWAVATPLLLSPPALAQSPPVKTKSFTHEWIHIEVISGTPTARSVCRISGESSSWRM
jgi:hypothetical protein